MNAINAGLMGRCAMIWTTAGTNRVCPRCLALKGSIVGYTNETGVTLPPIHPRCRCTIEYREVEKPRLTPTQGNGNVTSMNAQSNERSVMFDNGNRNGYTADFALMNSKAYHDRFDNLTKRKDLNEALYTQAAKIISHRSGTEYEELIILDARTGELLTENFSAVGVLTFQCGLSQAQNEELTRLGKKFVALHNHPNSSFPSPGDISALFKRDLQVGSVVVCHDGTVYYLEKLKPFAGISELVATTRCEVQNELPSRPKHVVDTMVSKRIITRLKRKKIMDFKEVP